MEKLEKALKGNSGSCYDAVVLECEAGERPQKFTG